MTHGHIAVQQPPDRGGPEPDSWGRWLARLAVVAIVSLASVAIIGALGSKAEFDCAAPVHGLGATVQLELAGTPDRADSILQRCDATPSDVRSSLASDVVFIAAYTALLVALALWFGPMGYRIKALRQRTAWVAGLAVAAGVCDLLEDGALSLYVGVSPPGSRWASVLIAAAAIFSWAKWFVLALVLLYVVVAMLGYVVTPTWVVRSRERWSVQRDGRSHDHTARLRVGPRTGATRATTATAATSATSATGGGGADGGTDGGGGEGAGSGGGGGGHGPPDATGVIDPMAAMAPGTHGLTLSGGGVRSASFGLGGLQAFESGPLGWTSAKRITAVSGGSYMAGAWAIARGTPPPDPPPPGAPPSVTAAAAPFLTGSPEDRHLRRHLGYLLQGAGRVPGAIFTLVVGLVINVAVLAGLLYLVATLLGLAVGSCAISPGVRVSSGDTTACLTPVEGGASFHPGPHQWVPVVAYLGLAFLAALVWMLTGRLRLAWVRPINRVVSWVLIGSLVLGLVYGFLLLALPWAMVSLPGLLLKASAAQETTKVVGEAQTQTLASSVFKLLGALGLFGAVVGALKKPFSKLWPRLGGVILALIALLVGLEWATNSAVGPPSDGERNLLIAFVAWSVVYFFSSSEWWSMAPFYRGRLRLAYATYRPDPADPSVANGYEDGDTPSKGPGTRRVEPSIYRYDAAGPEVEICCAMTVSDKSVSTHYGIPALSLRFSRDEVAFFVPRSGEPVADKFTCPSAKVEALMHRWDSPRLTTMAAVGMSGAAFSPAMGRASMGSTDALLAFANLRLGVWVPNPKYAAEGPDVETSDPGVVRAKRWTPYPRVRIGYLLKELFGVHDPDDLYVYVTDGGHWDNTGLVEQLRTDDLAEVVCLDGSGVAIDRLTSLSEAIDLAPQECGIDIRIRMDDLRADTSKTGPPPYAERCVTVGTIHHTGRPIALLWYAKPVLTRDTEARLLAYWERDSRYPAHGTIDQFFDEEQFDCYRLLGLEAGKLLDDARAAVMTALGARDTLAAFRTAAAVDGASWALVELAQLLRTEDEYIALRQAFALAP